MSTKSYKRLPENPNIKLHHEPTFNGFEVMRGVGPFVTPYLAKIDQLIAWAREQSNRLYAVRLDLRFPRNYERSGIADFSNGPIQRFSVSLERRLNNYFLQQNAPRRHDPRYGFCWAREYDKGHVRPHFHVLIVLNGNAFTAMGDIRAGGSPLYQMVEDSWLSTLRCPGFDVDRLVHVCESGQYRMHHNDQHQLNALFRRVSYMAKARDKDFSDGYHRFGCTRVSRKNR